MITLNRRQFLATSAAFSGLSASTGFAGTPFATLTAQQSDVQLLPGNYGKTSLWCFDGGSPGPEIRVAQGGRVQLRTIQEGRGRRPKADTIRINISIKRTERGSSQGQHMT